MGFLSRRLLICLLGIAAFCAPAFADASHDRTQFGHDIIVGPDGASQRGHVFRLQRANPGSR